LRTRGMTSIALIFMVESKEMISDWVGTIDDRRWTTDNRRPAIDDRR
jgi:hypothetical protein